LAVLYGAAFPVDQVLVFLAHALASVQVNEFNWIMEVTCARKKHI